LQNLNLNEKSLTMTLTSENIAAIETAPTVTTAPKRRGRPTGVKNGEGVRKKPVSKRKVSVTKIREKAVQANVEAIVANANLKNAKNEILHLTIEVETLRKDLNAAKLHIEKVEKQHKAALIVVGYLEGKVFNE
jgi:hypothetical protein